MLLLTGVCGQELLLHREGSVRCYKETADQLKTLEQSTNVAEQLKDAVSLSLNVRSRHLELDPE